MRRVDSSAALFERASQYIPGGVNSPVRAFRSVGLTPLYIDHGKGAHVFDVDGNEYIDYISSWGPLLLGHAYPPIQEAIRRELEKGTSYGACNAREVEMAELICTKFFPSVERVRMVNSGTEATMSAVRLARGFTGRDKIIKFEGCYHGHADTFLISAGSGLATFGQTSSAGVTKHIIEDTLVATYNDIESVRRTLEAHRGKVAAIILEPIMGNMGLIPPAPGFLEELRRVTEEEGVLLIFDEVISGFRAARGGAQELYGIRPDLTCLGKIIGGGLPVGPSVVVPTLWIAWLRSATSIRQGRSRAIRSLWRQVSRCSETLASRTSIPRLEEKGQAFEATIRPILDRYTDRLSYNRVGSLSTIFFTPGGVHSNADAKRSDTEAYARYFRGMIERGIYLPPSQFECIFLSMAHSREDFDRTATAMDEVLREVLG